MRPHLTDRAPMSPLRYEMRRGRERFPTPAAVQFRSPGCVAHTGAMTAGALVLDEPVTRGYVGQAPDQIHYRRTGRGPALVLLHSSVQSSRAFLPTMRAVSNMTAIAPDVAGFGESPTRSGTERSMDAYANDVVSLLDGLQIDQAHVAGLHTGNKIAVALAASHPERVSSLAILGMSHSIIPDLEDRNRAMINYIGHDPVPGADHSATSSHDWEETFAKVQRARFDGARQTNAEDCTPRASRALDLIQSLPGHDAMYEANFAFDWGQRLGAVQCPTLVVELVPASEAHVARQADTLAEISDSCTTTELALSDRELLEDNGRLLAWLLTDFCRNHAVH
jgi:pimeloyl-ACP methyl ester carboxylesterase